MPNSSNNKNADVEQMHEHVDPSAVGWLTYLWVGAISVLGGITSWIRKVRKGLVARWSLFELVGECTVAYFVGMLTYWATRAADMDPFYAAGLVGVASHMGSRSLYLFEQIGTRYILKRLGLALDETPAQPEDKQNGNA